MQRNIICILCSQCFIAFAYYLPYSQLVLISAQYLNVDELAYVLPILSFGNMIGRCIFSIVSKYYNIRYLYIGINLVSSLCILLILVMYNVYTIYIYIYLYINNWT